MNDVCNVIIRCVLLFAKLDESLFYFSPKEQRDPKSIALNIRLFLYLYTTVLHK